MLVGEALFIGSHQKRDLDAAFTWFKRASTNKHPTVQPEAIFLVAWCLERGHGVARDVDKAYDLYRQSAEKGYLLAFVPLVFAFLARGAAIEEQRLQKTLAILKDESHDDYTGSRLCRPFLLAEAHEFGHLGLTPSLDAAMAGYLLSEARGLIDAEQRLSALRAASDSSSSASCSVAS